MKGLPRIRRRPDSEPDSQETQPTTALPPDEQPTAVAGSPTDLAAHPTAAWPAPGAPAHHAEHGTEQIPAGADPEAERARPSFRDRGRLRRRLRYLRRVRELGFRDLGGLVFDLHRFGRRGDQLVAGKLAALEQVDSELRAIERVLRERQDIVELHEPGIAACPRCGALHGSEARFCPSCGMPFSGPRAVAEVGEGLVRSVGEIGAVGPVTPAAGTTASAPAPAPTAAPEPPTAPTEVVEQQPAPTEVVERQPPATEVVEQQPPATEAAAEAPQGEAAPAEPAGDEPAQEGPPAGDDATAAGEQGERHES